MRPKGLRAIRTIQGMAGKAKGGSREQAVAELARLEHERARLQRELEVWRQNERRVAEQLERVEGRLVELRALTADDPTPPQRPAARRRGAPERDRPRDDEPEAGWSGLSLEY